MDTQDVKNDLQGLVFDMLRQCDDIAYEVLELHKKYEACKVLGIESVAKRCSNAIQYGQEFLSRFRKIAKEAMDIEDLSASQIEDLLFNIDALNKDDFKSELYEYQVAAHVVDVLIRAMRDEMEHYY